MQCTLQEACQPLGFLQGGMGSSSEEAWVTPSRGEAQVSEGE